MATRWLVPTVAALLVVSAFVAPAAAQPGGAVDECENADRGPGTNGPPGFVADLVPDFLSDLFASLPVPNVGKSLVGAPPC